jgi:membrane fusion protein (multidrug efflux system)
MSTDDASPTGDAPDSGDAPETGASLSTGSLIALGVGTVLLLVLALPQISASLSADDGGTSRERAQSATGVDAVVVRPGSLTTRLQTTGTLRADESVALTSEASGKVTSIRFEEGERVEKGELLLQINDAELQAQKRRLEHRLTLARDRAERQKQLLAQGGVSQEEYDATVNEVDVLESELALVEAQIEKTQVRAPFSGTVGLRQVSEGSYLSPQTTIATLQRVRPMKVDLSVPAQYASQVGTGQSIRFTVRGSDSTYAGTVYAVEPQIDAGTRTLSMRARTPNPDGRLRPGAFADVTVLLGTVDDALTVPAFAVSPSLGTQRLFVVENGTAQPRNVTLGVRTDSTVQITSGLSPGDTVITSGIQSLRAGLNVRIETLDR